MVLSPGKILITTEVGAEIRNLDGKSLTTINPVGLEIMKELFSGKSIAETESHFATNYPNIPTERVRRETEQFIRKLYARGFINLLSNGKEAEIAPWKTEPITDAHLFITHHCNLECIHCLKVEEKRKELSIPKLKKLIDDLVEMGCTHLDMTGGEVTTKKGFLDLVEYAVVKGLAVGIGTNGTNWSEENMRRVIQLQPRKVNISIYSSNPGIHDSITTHKGSFYKSLEFAKRLIASGITVNFKCMVMKENFDTFEQVFELARQIGAGYQFDAHIIPMENGDTKPLEHRISEDQLCKFVHSRFYTSRNKNGATGESLVCTAGTDRISINAYGDVSPCAVFPINVGNINDTPLREIWEESTTLKSIRELRFKDMEKCGTCPLLPKCTPCPGTGYIEHGNFRETPLWSCKSTEALMKGGE